MLNHILPSKNNQRQFEKYANASINISPEPTKRNEKFQKLVNRRENSARRYEPLVSSVQESCEFSQIKIKDKNLDKRINESV